MKFRMEHSLCEAAGLWGMSTERALFMFPWLDLYDEGILALHNISSPRKAVILMEHEIPQGAEMSSLLCSSHILVPPVIRLSPQGCSRSLAGPHASFSGAQSVLYLSNYK